MKHSLGVSLRVVCSDWTLPAERAMIGQPIGCRDWLVGWLRNYWSAWQLCNGLSIWYQCSDFTINGQPDNWNHNFLTRGYRCLNLTSWLLESIFSVCVADLMPQLKFTYLIYLTSFWWRIDAGCSHYFPDYAEAMEA